MWLECRRHGCGGSDEEGRSNSGGDRGGLSQPFDGAEFARAEVREDRRRRRRRLFWLVAFALELEAYYYVVLSSWLAG